MEEQLSFESESEIQKNNTTEIIVIGIILMVSITSGYTLVASFKSSSQYKLKQRLKRISGNVHNLKERLESLKKNTDNQEQNTLKILKQKKVKTKCVNMESIDGKDIEYKLSQIFGDESSKEGNGKVELEHVYLTSAVRFWLVPKEDYFDDPKEEKPKEGVPVIKKPDGPKARQVKFWYHLQNSEDQNLPDKFILKLFNVKTFNAKMCFLVSVKTN